MQDRREPDVRQEIRCLFTVRSAAEFGSVDARRVAGTAGRRKTDRSSTPAGWPPPTCGARSVIVRERRRRATLGVAAAMGRIRWSDRRGMLTDQHG